MITEQVENILKRSVGRPPLDPEEETMKSHTIFCLSAEWSHCLAQPEGASAYVRRLITEDLALQASVRH